VAVVQPTQQLVEVPPGLVRHVRGLDGLRALAAVAVVGYHMQFLVRDTHGPLPAAASIGWIGVDLFFAISGFILFLPFVRAHRSGTSVAARPFYLRRARRILPGFWFNLVVVVLVLTPGLLLTAQGWGTILADATFTAGYVGAPSVNSVYWSLYCEVAFYLALPLLARAFVGRRWLWGLPLAIGIGLAFRATVVMASSGVTRHFALVMQFPGVIDQFAYGMVGAIAWSACESRARPVPRAALDGLVVLGSIGVVSVVVVIHQVIGLANFWSARGPMAPWPLLTLRPLLSLFFVMVIVGVCLRENVVRNVLELRPVRYLGLVSFGLYLWHLPLIRLLEPVLGEREASAAAYAAAFAVVLGITTLVAAISFHLVEAPFLKRPTHGSEHWVARACHRAAKIVRLPRRGTTDGL